MKALAYTYTWTKNTAIFGSFSPVNKNVTNCDICSLLSTVYLIAVSCNYLSAAVVTVVVVVVAENK